MLETLTPHRAAPLLAGVLLGAVLSLPARSTAETGTHQETVYYGERCFTWDEEQEGSCPASSEADGYLAAAQDPDDCPIIEVYEGSSYTGTECCYDVVMEACYDSSVSGCLSGL